MAKPYTELYVHLVWATQGRAQLITSEVEARLYSAINRKCEELGCPVIALNGYLDHVHLLIHMAPTIAIAALVKEIKGVSSHIMTHEIAPGSFFKWQGSYAAFTVDHRGLKSVGDYIRNQKVHHETNKLAPTWERSEAED